MGYDHWNCFEPEQNVVDAFTRVGYHPLAAYLLAARGINSPEQVRTSLISGIEGLYDPFLLTDMDKAVSRIQRALEDKETIAVYGDYDADGITAAAMLTIDLRRLGGHVIWYIPDRLSEGYGLNEDALQHLSKQGATLLITVDTGISAIDEVKTAHRLGMNVIITDHHECREGVLPEALALVNPKRPGNTYPFDGLAGVGVAFKLLCAINGSSREVLSRYGDLAALGTIADIMPMTGENRVIVCQGVAGMKNSKNFGLKTLLRQPELFDKYIGADFISYTLAPRINAAGRLGSADTAMELLLSEDASQCENLAKKLCEMNSQRYILEQEMLEQALGLVDLSQPVLVTAKDDWSVGLAGIVAGKLANSYERPVFLICVEGKEARGSARNSASNGINLVDVLSSAEDLLTAYGGHKGAAGFSLPIENIPLFKEKILERCSTIDVSQESVLFLDGEIPFEWVNTEGIGALEELGPFGSGFPSPVFCLKEVFVQDAIPLSQGKHTRLNLLKNGIHLNAVWFGHSADDVDCSRVLDVAGVLQINRFRGKSTPQILVEDIRISSCNEKIKEQHKVYAKFIKNLAITDGEASLLLPTRDDMAIVWRAMDGNQKGFPKDGLSMSCLACHLSGSADPVEPARVWVALDIFCEMGLIERKKTKNDRFLVRKNKTHGKADMTKSLLLQKLLSQGGVWDG
ncbi:MAG: single-stranded-DNA-specific exonuclease RecJ [Oscillospiraceae bacterium]|nr:single-stranded-DNA-specific exonuclease RecJ [Oscillospiraceae bacterium]